MTEIATSKNGVKVYVNLGEGHAATHFSDDAALLDLVKEILPTIELRDEESKFEHIFDRVIGECDLQTVEDEDEIVYAKCIHRDRYTKFVKDKPRHQCSSVTLILKRRGEMYELMSAWIGHLVPSFPRMHSVPEQDREEKTYENTCTCLG